jgi:hypothetical protein
VVFEGLRIDDVRLGFKLPCLVRRVIIFILVYFKKILEFIFSDSYSFTQRSVDVSLSRLLDLISKYRLSTHPFDLLNNLTNFLLFSDLRGSLVVLKDNRITHLIHMLIIDINLIFQNSSTVSIRIKFLQILGNSLIKKLSPRQ